MVVLAGCHAVSAPSGLPLENGTTSSFSKSSESLPDDELAQALENAIDNLAISGILSHSWASGNDIEPVFLHNFYCFAVLVEEYPDGWTSPLFVTANQYEGYLQSAFDVTAEHLRNGELYQADKQSYAFYYGFGAGPRCEITEITEEENKIVLQFQLYNPADQPTLHGTVELQQEDAGLKFLSCVSQKDERLLEDGASRATL